MRLAVRIADDPDQPSGRERRTYLEGQIALEGISFLVGANSTGKTTVLENVQQALEAGWEPRDYRGLYRPQRSFKELIGFIDLSPGSDDRDLLTQVTSLLDDRPLPVSTHETPAHVAARLARIATEATQAFAEEEVWHVTEDVPPFDELQHVALNGQVRIEPDGDDTWLTLDHPGPTFLWPFANADLDLRPRVVPPVVSAPAERIDTSRLAESLLADLLESWFHVPGTGHPEDPTSLPPRHPWLVSDTFDKASLALGVRAGAKLLGAEVRRRLPSFVRHEGEFTIQLLDPDRWTTGRHVVAGFTRKGEFHRAELTGSGTRRWLALCLELAATLLGSRRLDEHVRLDAWSTGFAMHDLVGTPALPSVLLIDEPELHLHLIAQREAAGWMRRRYLENDVLAIVAATHSPTILGASGSMSHILALRRGPERTVIETLGEDFLEALDELTVEAGLGREAWLFATKAVLVVEGQHDVDVMAKFFSRLLSSLRVRVRVLPLRGAKNSSRLIDSEFLGESGLPLMVLFDNVRAEALRTGASKPATSEERVVTLSFRTWTSTI